MNKEELKKELIGRKTFSIPTIQKELGLSYKQIRQCVGEMLANNELVLADDLNYKVVANASAANDANASKNRSKIQEYADRSKIDNGEDAIIRRRREIMQRLARLAEEDDDEEDDDDDVDVDEEPPTELMELYKRSIGDVAAEANKCKMIDCVDYGDDKSKANQITNMLFAFALKVALRAIQYGPSCTRYVFDFLSQKDMRQIENFNLDIADKLDKDNVEIVVPWHERTFCVVAQDAAEFDMFSKKALKHWIIYNEGRASIASIQRGLGIGFNRAGRILDRLRQMGCVVEQRSSANGKTKQFEVQVTLEEVDILFPESLGWNG